MLKKNIILLFIASAGVLSGCSTIHGNYACGVPGGVTCKSLNEVYNDTNGRLAPPEKPPSDNDKKSDDKDKKAEQESAYKSTLLTGQAINLPKIEPGQPLRVEPRLLRIWYAPWEDSDRVFHDQSFAYVVVDDGRWLLSQNRNQMEMSWRSRMVIPPTNRIPVSEEKDEKKPMMAPAATHAPNAAVQNAFGGATKSMEK